MLVGEFHHTLDAKRRLSVPAKFRDDLGSRMVLTRGLDRCLFLYPEKTWQSLAQKLSDLPAGQASTRSFVRLILAGAAEVERDKLGRILVPDYLRDYAELTKQVVLTGLFNRVEIWNEKHWEEYRARSEENVDDIAEKLGEIGAY